jgi:hypothetical protein
LMMPYLALWVIEQLVILKAEAAVFVTEPI